MIFINNNPKNKLHPNHIRVCVKGTGSESIRAIKIGKKYTAFEYLKESDKEENKHGFIVLSTQKHIEDYDESFRTETIERSKKFKTQNEVLKSLKRLEQKK